MLSTFLLEKHFLIKTHKIIVTLTPTHLSLHSDYGYQALFGSGHCDTYSKLGCEPHYGNNQEESCKKEAEPEKLYSFTTDRQALFLLNKNILSLYLVIQQIFIKRLLPGGTYILGIRNTALKEVLLLEVTSNYKNKKRISLCICKHTETHRNKRNSKQYNRMG